MLLRVSLVILLVGVNCMLTFGEETVFANNNNISAPGDDCSSALCDPESEMCDNDSRTCVCKETHVEVHGKCLKKAAYLGDDCIDDKQCKDFGEHSNCYEFNGDAACGCDPEKSFVNDDFSKCISFADKLGDPCTEDIQCQITTPGEHSYCEKNGAGEGKCSCSEGATNEPGRNKCLKLPTTLGEECEVHFQCIISFGDIAICYNRKCDCMPGIGVPNGQNKMCLYIRNELGGDCIESVQCHAGEPGEFSLCSESEKVCECNSESFNVPGRNKCLPVAKLIGEECVDNIKCQLGTPGEHSYCEINGAGEGKCSCSEGATNEPGGNKCLKLPTMLGDECEVDFQCITSFGNIAKCYDKRCDCMLGIGVPNQQKNKCLFIVNRLRDNCIEPIQCRTGEPGNFSICYRKSESDSETVCQCNSVTVNVPGKNKCLRIAQIIGEECENDIQCSHLICDDGWSNSICIKENCEETSKCRCIDAPVPLNYKDTAGLRILPGLYAKQPKSVHNLLMGGQHVVKKQNGADSFPVENLN